MRKYTLFLAVFALAITALTYYFTLPIQSPPKIVFNSVCTIDEFEDGKECRFPVDITNAGNSPLSISNIRTSCSCSGIEEMDGDNYSRSSSYSIDPGKSKRFYARFLVKVHPTSRFKNTIYFQTNDSNNPQARIDFVINKIRYGIYCMPPSLDYDNVLAGQPVSQVIVIRNDGNRIKTKITPVIDNSSVLKITELSCSDSEIQDNAIGKYRIELRNIASGFYSGYLVFSISGDITKTIQVPYQISARGAFSCTPTSFALSFGKSSSTNTSVKLLLRQFHSDEFSISSVHCPDYLLAKYSEVPSKQQIVDVSCGDIDKAKLNYKEGDTIQIKIASSKQGGNASYTVNVPVHMLRDD